MLRGFLLGLARVDSYPKKGFGRKCGLLMSTVLRIRKAASTPAMENSFLLGLGRCTQGCPLQVIASGQRPVGRSLVHIREIALHGFSREERDVLQTEGFENVFVEVVVEF